MLRAPEIVFRHVDHSPAIEEAIASRIERLERYYRNIHGCTVVVDAPHRHQHKGHAYTVSIDLVVPGSELVVSGNGAQRNPAHQDVYVAIRDAFNAMERQLKAFAEAQQPGAGDMPPV